MRSIATRLRRSPSTISRELERSVDGRGRYRSTVAQALAYDRAGRPKPAKLVTNLVLRGKVEKDLEKKYSPEQIVGCAWSSPTACRSRRSISRCMCSLAARSAAS
jgi:IS30 family transposase